MNLFALIIYFINNNGVKA